MRVPKPLQLTPGRDVERGCRCRVVMRVPKHLQLTVFAVVVALVSVASIVHVAVQPLEELARTRQGTPFFTPPVLNPDTGEAIEMDTLVEHYKSEG